MSGFNSKLATATLAGGTGLVGSAILSNLLTRQAFAQVYAYSRRELQNPTASTKLFPLTSTDASSWASLYPNPAPQILFSALGTTKGAAGSVEAQRKIDLDLNYELAKTAKENGTEVYVLISSSGANATSMLAYPKMKGELEEKVKALGFKHVVILRPGLIVGNRQESRPAEAVVRGIAGKLGSWTGGKLTDFWAQDHNVIAGAAVEAGLRCLDGRKEEGVWMVWQNEIVELGKKKE